MKTCCRCGSSARLRYDRGNSEWLCVVSCGAKVPAGFSVARTGASGLRVARARPRRPALFNAWWSDPASGERWRATRSELVEVTRLYYQHADIREGRAQ